MYAVIVEPMLSGGSHLKVPKKRKAISVVLVPLERRKDRKELQWEPGALSIASGFRPPGARVIDVRVEVALVGAVILRTTKTNRGKRHRAA